MAYVKVVILLIFLLSCLGIQGQTAIKDTVYINKLIDSVENAPISRGAFEHSKKILDLSRQINYQEGIGFSIYNIACYYDERKDYVRAINQYQDLEDFANSIQDDDYLAHAYFGLSRDYLALGLTKQADEYLEKVLNIAEQMKDSVVIADVYAQIGLYYVERQFYDKAIHYLNSSMEISKEVNSINYFPVENYNLGLAYIETGRTNLAIPYFLEYIDYIKKEKDSLSFGNAFGNLAYAYQNIQLYDKAFVYFDSSLYYSNRYNQIEDIYIAYSDMSDAYKDKGNYEMALIYHQKYHNLKDSMVNYETKQYVNSLKVEFETEQKEKEIISSQKEIYKLKSEKQNIWLLLGSIFSIMTIISLILLRMRSDAKRKLQLRVAEEEVAKIKLKNKELEAQNLQNELSSKKQDLTNLAIDIARKNDFSEELIKKLNQLTESKDNISKVDLQKIINYLNNELKVNEDLSLLHKNVNQINQTFYQKLDKHFGKLSVNDKYVLGLIRLNLSNKEIASIKGISPSSAKVLRYRLRKKMQLTPDTDIVQFLQNF